MTDETWCMERTVRFRVDHAFYRAQSQTARDLGVLAATVYRLKTNRLRVLEGMAGCGVRSLRYAQEAAADWVWVNDADPTLAPLLHQNFAPLPASRYRLSHQGAQRLFVNRYCQEDFFDWVDVDGFGSGADCLDAALSAVKLGGLLYMTSTDGQALARRTLQTYGVWGRSHPAIYEQGLRLLLGCAHHLATLRGFGIHPIFAYFSGQTWRVLLQLQRPLSLPAIESCYGFVGYCPTCGNYTSVPWKHLGYFPCPQEGARLQLSGPLWRGALYDSTWLHEMRTQSQAWGWTTIPPLLDLFQQEARMPPYYHLLGDLGRRGQCDLPRRSRLIQTLQDWGFQASRTHLHPQAIKTTAEVATCVRAAQCLTQALA